MSEMKAFLLFEDRGWSEQHGAVIRPECVVLAETIEEAAKKIGGKVEERGTWDDKEDVLVFPKSIFVLNENGDEYYPAGSWLEYKNGNFYISIFPEDKEKILNFRVIPLVA